MPQGYHHLKQEQRCQIYGLKKSKMVQQNIAAELGVSQATISRELRRNAGKRGYRYGQAHTKAAGRKYAARAVCRKMTPANIIQIEKMLTEDQLSPEQISGRLKFLGVANISHESIYLHIWKNKREGGSLYQHLRRCGKKYNKRSGKLAGRGLIPNRVDIALRPAEVAAKSRVGNFEGDTIIGKEHRGAVMTMVERKTMVTLMHHLSSTKSDETAAAIIQRMLPIKQFVQTITTDNGKEFAQHESIAKNLDAKFFFAQPYHSWEQ
jgi:IS30 family transposase